MSRYRTLGDGLLAAFTGLTRQAFHKARSSDIFGVKVRATFDRAVRAKLDLKLPRSGGQGTRALVRAAGLAYGDRIARALSGDLKKTHKVADQDATARELADMLDVPYSQGVTIGQVLKVYLTRVLKAVIECLDKNGDLSSWTWGKLELTGRQLRTLARYAFRRSDGEFRFG